MIINGNVEWRLLSQEQPPLYRHILGCDRSRRVGVGYWTGLSFVQPGTCTEDGPDIGPLVAWAPLPALPDPMDMMDDIERIGYLLTARPGPRA